MRLRSAAHGVVGSQVADIQRGRILAAMFEAACEHGAGSVTVADVVERSGVSRRTFYEVFADREDCFMAALHGAVARVSERIVPVYRAAGSWRERIRAGVIELLGLFEEEPLLGRLLVCESLTGGAQALECRKRVLAAVRSAVDEGRHDSRDGTALPPLTAEATVGGALAVIHSRLLEPGHASLVELANPLTSMIVLPYLGAAAARGELARPLPATPAGPQQISISTFDPFKDAGMRLTYRTVRVLMAIAETPSASNRTIGTRAGIADPGQISKLLSRLERAGLVCNTSLAPGQGAPNAWLLTASGEGVVRSIRTNAESPGSGRGGAASDVFANKHS